MKILSILSSKRRLGNSETLLLTAKKELALHGASIVDINLANLNIKQCQGCLACVFKGKCSIDDDMHLLLDNLLEADGLIIAAPTYILSPVGTIKLILDRALMVVSHLPLIKDKLRYALTISVAGSPLWNPLGKEILNQFAIAYQYRIFDAIEAYSPGPAEVLLDDALINEVKTKSAAMAKSLKSLEIIKHQRQDTCPKCLSNTIKITEQGPICPVCLTKAKIVDGHIYFDEQNPHFFDADNLLRHAQTWILPSREKFLANRAQIKEKIRKEGFTS